MNKVMAIGRLTREPDIKWSQDGQTCIARYTLAIDRTFQRRDSDRQTADFPSCIAFGKSAEFVKSYLHKGMKIAIEGHIQTGHYTAQDGHEVYTTTIVVDRHYFCEGRRDGAKPEDGFMDIPEGIEESLPFDQ